MKRKTSEIWCFFRAVDDTFAVCNICKAKLSYKTTTTNLSKHMNRMHPTSGLNRNSKYKFQPQTTIAIDRNKAKPRNSTQELILLEFVKKHPRLLQNPTWETRGNLESLWEELSNELNSHGPPRKDIATWRRALKDWKRFILRKVEKNEMQNMPFGTSLSSSEETIATLCRLNEDVSQIIMKVSDDEMHENSTTEFDVDEVEDVVPEEDGDALQTSAEYVYEPEENKTDIDPLYLQSNKRAALASSRLEEEDTTLLDKISNNLGMVQDTANSVQLALNEFFVLYKQKLYEDKRHHLAIEQLMAEKIELKKKLLEIEQKKLSLK
ncbi:uncharacterized protein LOC6727754 [Drosophila simulans]|uniref:Regulatory protein zeste n=1 Tax=Drosophila simulans TaxID=7240 RepID=B4QWC8_DROSI|nr:uncharacterized protein LOC6727754 [Drosophila simulans]EDX12619.1 GD20256 [Drosophila simulans]KMZ03075.1 uncharacterized protein Dsimw501_GD20256 [Drosophila simulans]